MMYLGMACEAMTYINDFGVIATLHHDTDWFIRIWSLEPTPVAVSAPTLSAGSVQQGRRAFFRVQVTGDQNEPCPEEYVNWTLTGAGTLLITQSATDVDGYATTAVQYASTDTGSTDIGASVSC